MATGKPPAPDTTSVPKHRYEVVEIVYSSDKASHVVAELVERICHVKYGDISLAIEASWHAEIYRRIADLENGRVQGAPVTGIRQGLKLNSAPGGLATVRASPREAATDRVKGESARV